MIRRTRFSRYRRKEEQEENSDRWLLTYADMITLLLGLFIILYSISQVDQNKLKQVADLVRSGFGLGESFFDGSAVNLEEDALLQPRTQLYRFWERISYALKKMREKTKLMIGMNETEEIRIQVFTPALGEGDEFHPDEDTDFTFKKIAEVTQGMDVDLTLRVQIPYSDQTANQGFRSVWEYNAHRATLVAEVLSEKYGIPKDRISVQAFNGFKKIGKNENTSPEMKASQERIEILIRKKDKEE
ncbi:proton-channel complex MotA/MotB membrane protein MotB [Leptospira fainei serovar Hurstbridge str. BUT 6]|uniref:Proton-channel complex MotA/MotB membrane protein MotB n=1 Tax=Leptospira fainei serovar Hurstbridge str. BUT 6 TaxID=1193011 RepID=S3UYA4_9LEPT|nr:flagellar motor protein MotB [Leptospira fainei]EPG74198.1 proton-channel complex MotA/MotB membrane protein MotB [Leptospira fainei serovar Hurstbridge str. BUT 6]